MDPPVFANIRHPIRVARSSLLAESGLEKWVQVAARTSGKGGIIVLLDSDEACPRDLAGHLQSRAASVRSDIPIAVVLAKREFEAWFVAAASSLADTGMLVSSTQAPASPEDIGDAKGWIKKRMVSKRYQSSVDQVRLANKLDLMQAQGCRSFRKFYKEVTSLLEQIAQIR